LDDCDKIWHLFAKSLNKEISPEENEQLLAILKEDASLSQQYELLTRIWNEGPVDTSGESQTDEVVSKIIRKAGAATIAGNFQSSRWNRSRFTMMIAASLAVFVVAWWGLGIGRTTRKTLAETSQRQLITQKGSRSRFLLPDGTVVWLNSGSKLALENDFSGASREVRLEGEAYFNVTRQPGRPFIVHTSGINIKVLGTVFNVKAYAEDKNIETTLYKGSVKVFRENEPEASAINLSRNEKLVLSRTEPDVETRAGTRAPAVNPAFTIIPLDSTKQENERFETAWLYSRLEFRGDDFDALARKLERWYNITVVFTDDEVRKLNFNGSFEKETAEQAFTALQAALPRFSYKINNQEVTVSSMK